MSTSLRRKVFALLMLFDLLAAGVAVAAERQQVETGSHQQAGGVDIYYGVVAAQVAGRHPPRHEEQQMHGGVPAGENEYHLIVALFDAGGKRLSNAAVTATVGEFGMAGTRRRLEPMRIAETTSFGNYFALRRGTIYRIALEIRRHDKPNSEMIEALFDYRLQ